MTTESSPAPHGPRLVASVLDAMLVSLLLFPAVQLTEAAPTAIQLGAILLAAGIPTFLVEGMLGRSLGKAALGLRHAAPGDEPPTDLMFAPRYGVKWLIPLTLISLGLRPAAVLWVLLDYLPALRGDRRTIHDRVAGTRVLAGQQRVR